MPPSGPDTFGYEGAVIASNLRDATGGTELTLGDSGFIDDIPLGFTFDYYGMPYSTVRVSSDGLIDFDEMGNAVQFAAAGNGLTDNANYIGPFMTDLNPSQGSGSVYYQTTGVAGSREFVVGFYDVSQADEVNASTFELILHESDDEIEFQFGDLTTDLSLQLWISMENSNGSDGLTFRAPGDGAIDFGGTGYLIAVPEESTGNNGAPEPSTAVLLIAGLFGLATRRRRR